MRNSNSWRLLSFGVAVVDPQREEKVNRLKLTEKERERGRENRHCNSEGGSANCRGIALKQVEAQNKGGCVEDTEAAANTREMHD